MNKKFVISLILLLALTITGCTQYLTNQNSTTKVAEAKASEIIELKNSDLYTITASQVVKIINNQAYEMYAYNKMIPGPTLKVMQGSKITVELINDLPQETTIHWHGLRQNVKDDGVPGTSQKPVQPGEKYTYNLYFPDAGIYWYHPHIREDQQQDLGLAGNILVVPQNNLYNPVNREELLMLDDIAINNKEIVPYGKEKANFALMGRYGNIMLVNGKTNYNLTLAKGDVVRFYITDTSNVRPYNLSIPRAKIKLVGSDLGLYKKETYVDSIVITPGERYIIETYFQKPGEYQLININPIKSSPLGSITITEQATTNDYSAAFNNLEENEELFDVQPYLNKKPDYNLRLSIDSSMMMGGRMGMGGMPCHRMPDGTMMGNCEENEELQPIEWEDTMSMMNQQATTDNTKWIIHDETTDKENMDIGMQANVGDKIKIRIFNDEKSMHPMQHPIHLHGQRFLVLAINNKPVENHVWKDTTLIPIGSTVDLLVDVTNPGEWMFHCHISEHLEAGMMTTLTVK